MRQFVVLGEIHRGARGLRYFFDDAIAGDFRLPPAVDRLADGRLFFGFDVDQRLQGTAQFIDLYRVNGPVVHGARLHGTHRAAFIAASGEHQDGHAGREIAQTRDAGERVSSAGGAAQIL